MHMPTDDEIVDLTTDAKVALRDLHYLAATIRELVERADAGRLTTGIRAELVPDALDRAEAVYRFLLEQAPRTEVAA